MIDIFLFVLFVTDFFLGFLFGYYWSKRRYETY